jgi:CubicO group peptidase (beta-lactamase class C family)
MKNFRYILYFIWIGGLMLLMPFIAHAQTSLINRMDAVMASEPTFSGVVLVAKDGRKLFHKAYGVRDYNTGVKLRKDDIFELASVSKQFTASIIIGLQETGQLGFDDPIAKYVDIPYPGIKIRHLLNHTSGLPDYQAVMDKHWDKSKVAGNPDILAYLKRFSPPALFKPGERFDYSNTGYVVLASIAESVSGMDFIELCRSRIFKAAGMQGADIRTNEIKAGIRHFARGHVWVENRQRFVRADSFPSSDYTIWLGNRKGPGRVSARAGDLLAWDAALRAATLTGTKSGSEAYRSGVLNDGSQTGYGFGWFLSNTAKGEKVIWHDGDNPGYKTMFRRYPDSGHLIIVLSNNYPAGFDRLIQQLEAAL